MLETVVSVWIIKLFIIHCCIIIIKREDLKSDVYKLHMTMLLPNTNQLQCPSGLKVQLLYWDGSKYSKVFPNGTRIGFAVARAGI